MKILLGPWRRRGEFFELHGSHARDRRAVVAFFPLFFPPCFPLPLRDWNADHGTVRGSQPCDYRPFTAPVDAIPRHDHTEVLRIRERIRSGYDVSQPYVALHSASPGTDPR